MTPENISHCRTGNRMDPVTIGLTLADALNRERALTPAESHLVASLVGRIPGRRALRRWTGAQDAALLDLVEAGYTAAEIGVRVERSTAAIHTRIKRLKVAGSDRIAKAACG